MREKEEEVGKPVEEAYTQPLLTKHEQLRSLTGKSGEKDSDENSGPNGNGNGNGHGHGHGRGGNH